MTASRTSPIFFALLIFLALPADAQTPDAPPAAVPYGRDASFLPPGDPVPLVPQTNPPPANAPPVLASPPLPPGSPADVPDAKQKPVESEALQNIDPDAIGLLAPEDGGLGAAMWKGTPRELVDRLLPPLALPNSSSALNALAQRFLLTIASVPQGTADNGQSLTSARIEKLIALGDVADAWNLALLAKPGQIDEVILRLAAESALVNSENKNVCAKLPELMQAHNSPEWQKLLVVCQLRVGDIKAAQLGLEVLHAQNVKDDLFFDLAEHNIIGGAKSLPRQLTPLKPLNLALLRLIDQPLSSEIYAHPDAALIPELLQTKTHEDNLRLALAERAATRGLINGSQLAAAYASAVATPDQLANAVNSTENNPHERAMLYQATLAEKTPQKRFEAVSKFLEGLDTAPLNVTTAQILAEMIGTVEADGEYYAWAPVAVRILIMAGKPKEALGWLKLARQSAVSVPAVAAQLQDLWPFIVLSGLETDADYGHAFGPWLQAALKDASSTRREQTGDMLLLFDAAGFTVPEDAFAHVADLPAAEKRIVPPPALLMERLRAAGAANRRGETVLLALAIAGSNANESTLLPALDTIRVLQLTGLKADALALARETASALLASSGAAAKP